MKNKAILFIMTCLIFSACQSKTEESSQYIPSKHTHIIKKEQIEIAEATVKEKSETVEISIIESTQENIEENIESIIVEEEILETYQEEEYNEPSIEQNEEETYINETYEDTTSSNNMTYLGNYYITHYSAEACGNAIGAAEVPGGLVEGVSIAVPEYWMLGHWFYIENYGTFRADDISPDGIFDIFH